MSQHYYYIRHADGTVLPEDDFMTWARWFEKGENTRVEATDVNEDLKVSTVFLGMNHNHGFGGRREPILFETMIFRSCHPPKEIMGRTFHEEGREQWRWYTEAEARRGHAFIVGRLREDPTADLGDYDPLTIRTEIERLEGMVEKLKDHRK